MKKETAAPAPPEIAPGIHAAVRDLAPRQSILPASRPQNDISQAFARANTVTPTLFQSTGDNVTHMAEMRIRHWILQQEAEARRKQASRLLPPG